MHVRSADCRRRLRASAAAASIAALLLAGCDAGSERPTGNDSRASERRAPEWSLEEQGDAAVLALVPVKGEAGIQIICQGDGKLLVNVPAFRAVGSEERMTFGQGATVETLVADPAGDRERGGVTASGPVPANLDALLSGRVAANYGAQNSGPHPPLPPQLVSRFVDACRQGEAFGQDRSPVQAGNAVSACLIQGDARLPSMNLRAIGTEPFWGARIEGRCVTYSTPENIDGTRIWTTFDGSADRGVWRGYYNEREFILRTRPEPNCSDGMSDNVYPVAVTLKVGGEERTGCAEYRQKGPKKE